MTFYNSFRMYAEMKKRGEPIPVERANIITAYDDEDRWKRDVDKFKPATTVTSKYFLFINQLIKSVTSKLFTTAGDLAVNLFRKLVMQKRFILTKLST